LPDHEHRSEHIGGSARGYLADFASLAAQQWSNAQAARSVCLCIGVLGGRTVPDLPLSVYDLRLGLVCTVIRDSGLVHVQAFHGLAGDLSDEVEVLIEVQHGQAGEFGSRGDDQIWY